MQFDRLKRRDFHRARRRRGARMAAWCHLLWRKWEKPSANRFMISRSRTSMSLRSGSLPRTRRGSRDKNSAALRGLVPDRCCWTRRADFCNGDSSQHARALKRASFWRASTEPGGPYRRLLREAKLMMRNRLAGAQPISYLRVGRAIGQAGNGPVTAETEIFRSRVAHRPAAMPLLKFEQRVGLRTLAGYFW
jgi:hypothetical protein